MPSTATAFVAKSQNQERANVRNVYVACLPRAVPMQMGSVFMHTLPKIRLVIAVKAAAATAVTAAFYDYSKPNRTLHATHAAYTAFEHMW